MSDTLEKDQLESARRLDCCRDGRDRGRVTEIAGEEGIRLAAHGLLRGALRRISSKALAINGEQRIGRLLGGLRDGEERAGKPGDEDNAGGSWSLRREGE